MWIFTKAGISKRPKDIGNFISKLHSITEAANKTWDFLCVTDEWIQQSSMECQGSNMFEVRAL